MTENLSNHCRPQLFYDGQCGLCSAVVRFVLRYEKTPQFNFAPLQGETASQLLKDSGLPADIGEYSMVVILNGKFLTRSAAVIAMMRVVGGPWKIAAVALSLIPTPVRDEIYSLVSRYRRRFFQTQSCMIIPPHQRERFLP